MPKVDLGQKEFLKLFKVSLKSEFEMANNLIQDYIKKNLDSPELEDLSTFKIRKETEAEIKEKEGIKKTVKEKTVETKTEELAKEKDEKSIKKKLDNAPVEDLIYILDQNVEE